MNLFTKQKQSHRLRGPTDDYLGEKGQGDRLGVWDWHVHIKHTIFKMYNEQGLTVQHRELCSIFCNSLNGKRI